MGKHQLNNSSKNKTKSNHHNSQKEQITNSERDNEKEVSSEEMLKKLFNFTDFSSSKNKSHVDSDLSGVFKGKNVKRVYRQYMNRRGGFNKNFIKPSQQK